MSLEKIKRDIQAKVDAKEAEQDAKEEQARLDREHEDPSFLKPEDRN